MGCGRLKLALVFLVGDHAPLSQYPQTFNGRKSTAEDLVLDGHPREARLASRSILRSSPPPAFTLRYP